MLYIQSHAFSLVSYGEHFFKKKSTVNNHRMPHEVSTLKNDNGQHFNYRQP